MALLYKADGSVEIIKDLSLENMQKAVGGYIEIVRGRVTGNLYVCDEDGKLTGKKLNEKATMLAHHDNAIATNDYFVGDVIIAKKDEIK